MSDVAMRALSRFVIVVLAVMSMPALAALPQRTFVASTGSDANPCSITLPCRGFAAAVALTNPGGEVIVLDSAGYGPVTITQAVSIIAPAGVYAGISVVTGDGITVNAGASDKVVLRGLTINGQGGGSGIRVSAGKQINIEDCAIGNMTTAGILVEGGTLTTIARTVVRGVTNFGIWASPSSPITLALTMTDTDVTDNGNAAGIYIAPVVPGSVVNAALTRVTSSNNFGSGIVVNTNSAGAATLALQDSSANENGSTGVSVTGTNAIAIVSGSSFAGNTAADLGQFTGGVLRTAGNNALTGRGAADVLGSLTTNLPK